MLAIPISWSRPPRANTLSPGQILRFRPATTVLGILLALQSLYPGTDLFAAEPEQIKVVDSQTNSASSGAIKGPFEEARRRYLAATNDTEAPWQFARACFDAAVTSRRNPERT